MGWYSAEGRLGLLAIAAALGCSETADPQAQLVVVVDTDAPIVSQAQADPALSLDAAVDSLRVDILEGADESPFELVVPDVRDWPVSFGIAALRAGTVRLQIRAYRGALASAGRAGERTVADPPRWASIERAVDLSLDPNAGVRTVRVTLGLGCMGVPSDFVDELTCLNEHERQVPFTHGVEQVADSELATRAGTSSLAREVDCVGSPPAGAICIRGGLTLLGDPLAVGLPTDVFVDPIPPKPVVVAPFYMDRYEVTLAGFAGVEDDLMGAPPSTAPGCTWAWASNPDYAARPLNCVSWETALEACQLLGGSLPTEAEWEHAARGRGQGRRYVWGNAPATCCAASIAKPFGCAPATIEDVGSHEQPAACDGIADVSRDGVVDLAGSVSEHVLDAARAYDDACWGKTGLARNPSCAGGELDHRVARGGNYTQSTLAARAAVRSYRFPEQNVGFRCVYPGAP